MKLQEKIDRELKVIVDTYLDAAMESRDCCATALRLAFLHGRASGFEETLDSMAAVVLAETNLERPS